MEGIEIIVSVIAVVWTLIAAYTDLKRNQIPLWNSPSLFALALIQKYVCGHDIVWDLLGMGIVFIAAMAATFAGMGGGDVLLFSALAFLVGTQKIVPFFLFLSAEAIVYAVIQKAFLKKKGKMQVPLAPFCILPLIYVIFF